MTLHRVVLTLILGAASGCHHWQRVTPYAPLESRVRVERPNGEQLIGTLVRRSSDSLFIRVADDDTRVRAVSIGDIRFIDQRVFSGKRNATFIAGAALGALIIYSIGTRGGTSTEGTGTIRTLAPR